MSLIITQPETQRHHKKIQILQSGWLMQGSFLIEEALCDYPSYGYRRIAKHLEMNRKPIQRVMKFFGLKAFRRRGRKPKKNNNKSAVNYPNLLLQIIPSHPNHIWAFGMSPLQFAGQFAEQHIFAYN